MDASAAALARVGLDADALRDLRDADVDALADVVLADAALDDAGVGGIARACRSNRGAFLVAALRAGRTALVVRLAPDCTPRQEFGANRLSDVPLVAAAEAGAVDTLAALVGAGARPNVALRGVGTPLHCAIRNRALAPSARARLVHELLRLGAVPQLGAAYALAQSFGDVATLEVLREHGLAYGPRQSREARARGVRDVRLLYDKADGLVYRIGQPDVAFLEGGDYDGIGPCSIAHFRTAFDRLVGLRPDARLAWFEPFLRQLEQGREFGYDELVARAPWPCFERFDTTTNWSQALE